jgi:hypothetical protein
VLSVVVVGVAGNVASRENSKPRTNHVARSHGHAAGRLGSVPSIFRVDGSVRRKGDRSAYDHRLAPSRQLRHIHLCGRRSLRKGSGRPGGSAVVEAGPGDFLHVPKGAIHREGNLGDEESRLVVVRAGHGPAVVNVD